MVTSEEPPLHNHRLSLFTRDGTVASLAAQIEGETRWPLGRYKFDPYELIGSQVEAVMVLVAPRAEPPHVYRARLQPMRAAHIVVGFVLQKPRWGRHYNGLLNLRGARL